MVPEVYTYSMETSYLSLVQTGSWENLFHEKCIYLYLFIILVCLYVRPSICPFVHHSSIIRPSFWYERKATEGSNFASKVKTRIEQFGIIKSENLI